MNTPDTGIVHQLIPLFRRHPWGFPTLIGLGVLQSLTEGIGIWLVVPLLHGLVPGVSGPQGGKWFAVLDRLFQRVPSDWRMAAIAGAVFGAVLLTAILGYLHQALLAWLDGDIAHVLRHRIFAQLLSVSVGFLERDRSGRLLNVLSSDTWRTSDAMRTFVHMITTVTTIAVYVGLLILVSWRLTLLVALGMLLVSGLMRRFTKGVRQLGDRVKRLNEELAQRMVEGIDGIRVIRAFGREPYEQERFDIASTRLRRSFLRMNLLEEAVHPVHEILISALLLLTLLATAKNAGDVPAFLVFVFVLYRLQPRVKDLERSRVHLAALTASVQEVVSMIDTHDKEYVSSGHLNLSDKNPRISFRSVSFQYGPAAEPALSDISFDILPGKTTALVGPSGAGKSTIIKLLLRFHDPTTGTILVNDRALPEFSLEDWRAQIAFVSQETFLFNATVRENIIYGRLDATDAQIMEAARQADAHTFIKSLPDGYDTLVGHRGVRLSGGQQQRISLTRALIRNPRLLILDEATNALDSISEEWIQETLKRLKGERTVIAIAHRLATVEDADQIIVLDQGQVKERGTLPTLIANRGLFSRLYRLQHRNRATTVPLG